MVKGFTLALREDQNEDLLPVCWGHTTTDNSLSQLSCQLNSFLTSSFQHLNSDVRWACSLAAFHFAECSWGWGSSRQVLRELIAWPLKLDIKQPSIMLNPCFHLVFIDERKLTSIIAYTILTNNVLVCAVYLFGDTENTITILGYCSEFLLLCFQLCQPDGKLCQTFGANIGSFCRIGLSHLASLVAASSRSPFSFD